MSIGMDLLGTGGTIQAQELRSLSLFQLKPKQQDEAMAGATKATETAAGKATFSSQRGAVFRFSVTPTRIWLEQQATKQQWCVCSLRCQVD